MWKVALALGVVLASVAAIGFVIFTGRVQKNDRNLCFSLDSNADSLDWARRERELAAVRQVEEEARKHKEQQEMVKAVLEQREKERKAAEPKADTRVSDAKKKAEEQERAMKELMQELGNVQ